MHSHAVDALIPAHSSPGPAALHDLQTPSGPVYLRPLLWHCDGKEKIYQWHHTGNPTDIPPAAGSASSSENRNRKEKHQKCSGGKCPPTAS